MVLIAIINGAARDLMYKPYIVELAAHQISTFILIIFFGFYIWFAMNKYSPASGKQSIYIGIIWLAMTLLFEFGFGIARNVPAEKLLGDYNILNGRLWVLILICVTLTPYIFYKAKIREKRNGEY
jgi:hypothetical protein